MDTHAREDETRFRIVARRNRLVGLWAAQRLGKVGAAADEYAMEVMFAELMEPGDDDIIAKLCVDFEIYGVDVPAAEIAAMLRDMSDEAQRQLTH